MLVYGFVDMYVVDIWIDFEILFVGVVVLDEMDIVCFVWCIV